MLKARPNKRVLWLTLLLLLPLPPPLRAPLVPPLAREVDDEAFMSPRLSGCAGNHTG